VASSHSSGTLPPEGERLLAVAPENFVAERNRVARELKDAGRAEDAQAVAALKKPPAVVLAVNRAARDRSAATRDAVKAAERVR
jgi:ketosteroid isomerase-like protein